MVFITAGMGGGTGTGAAPIIAKAAKEMGILTVGIVTMPYKTEGPLRMKHAEAGIEELKKGVDSLLVINNENIQEIYGKLPITEAFGKANDVLATAARGIAEIITRTGFVNVDFADVCTVMTDSGVAMMGSGRAGGESRSQAAAEMALASPLLDHRTISGANDVLINITYGDHEITLDEASVVRDYIHNCAGEDANVIWGAGKNDMLGDEIEVTVIATRFKPKPKEESEDTATTGKGKGPDWGGVSGNGKGSQVNLLKIPQDQYKNIDNLINIPAFRRRNIKFAEEIAAQGEPKRQTKKEAAQEAQPQGNTLFDN